MGSHIRVVLLTVPADDLDVAADALWAAGAKGIEERPGPTPATRTLVADVAPGEVRPGWQVEPAEVDDGRDAWRAHARAWRVGLFTIRPPWIAKSIDRSIDVVIDPGHTFGSGSHPTTRMMLMELPIYVGPGCRVLDVGCGSGVLAICAARLGARPVDAVDIDLAAIEATTANVRRNGVFVQVTELARVRGRYDVILANISAAALCDLAPQLAGATPKVVLSGFLEEQAGDVAAAYLATAPGFVELGRRREDGWVTLVLGTPDPPH